MVGRIGPLRTRITIQQKGTPARDEFRAEVITWAAVATVWAEEMPMNGRELIEARREVGEMWTRFRIRYRTGLNSAMRISKDAGARIFDIQNIQNVDDRNRELVITCREVVTI